MVRVWYSRSAAHHSMVAVWSRYSLGTLPVRSWYGIFKFRSRLVFSTLHEPGTCTVLFIVQITCNRGLAGFGSAIDIIPYAPINDIPHPPTRHGWLSRICPTPPTGHGWGKGGDLP